MINLLEALKSGATTILSGNTGIAGTAGDPPPLITGTIDIGGGSTTGNAAYEAANKQNAFMPWVLPVALMIAVGAGFIWIIKKLLK